MTNNRITRSDLDSIRYRRHAVEKMIARQVARDEVEDALLNPTITEPSRNPGTGQAQVRYVKGDLVVVYDPQTREVVTLLLRRFDQWNDDDMRKRRR